MSTFATTKEVKPAEAKAKANAKAWQRVRDFIATAAYHIQDSIGDLLVTITITALTLVIMTAYVHPALVQIVGGFYISGMVVVLVIRIVHRFDSSYTTDEIALRIDLLEEKVNEINAKV